MASQEMKGKGSVAAMEEIGLGDRERSVMLRVEVVGV
jgi:hypothetical protein